MNNDLTSELVAEAVQRDLRNEADPARAAHSLRFFKTGPGQYGEGDQFIGATVPQQREIARKYRYLPLDEVEKLLQSPFHEVRLTALFILVGEFKRADNGLRDVIAKFYLKNRAWVNNWDLVDSSASYILGPWLENRDRNVLYELVKSESLWDRRISVLAAGYFIKKDDFNDTLRLADILMNDKQDLMHKAVGWMLREVGKRDEAALVDYLAFRYEGMPRTMLRYAIEKFEPARRQAYLRGDV